MSKSIFDTDAAQGIIHADEPATEVKIAAGLYHYEGWEIEKLGKKWNMKPIGSDSWTDAAKTLTEAKAMADRFNATDAAAVEPEPVEVDEPVTAKPEVAAPAVVLGKLPEWVLGEEELRRRAPAIYATEPHAEVSEKYGFISTTDMIAQMVEAGYAPSYASQAWPRNGAATPTARHMVRMRHIDSSFKDVGDCIPEIVFDNSHNRSSRFRMNAGLFRLACSNGLVVSDSVFHSRSFRHSPDVMSQVIEGSFEVLEIVPNIAEDVRKYNDLLLTKDEQLSMASSLMEMIFNAEVAKATDLEKAIAPRRYEDEAPSLWNTFNILQERVEKGGIIIKQKRQAETRGLVSPTTNIATNKALWELMDDIYKEKALA